MANQDAGECECPLCGIGAHVRRYNSATGNNTGKIYVACPNCGPIMSTAKGAQIELQKRARMFDGVPVKVVESAGIKKRKIKRAHHAAVALHAPPAVVAAAAAAKKTFGWDD